MISPAVAIGILGIAAMRQAHRRCDDDLGYGWPGPPGDASRDDGAWLAEPADDGVRRNRVALGTTSDGLE